MPYKDPDEQREYNKKYYQKNKEKIKKRAREWKINNREQYLLNKRKWYLRNKEKHCNGVKESRRKHIENTRKVNRKRYNSLKEEIENMVGKKCVVCGIDKKLCFHEIHFKRHKEGVGGWYEVRKRPEDFIRLCFKCHVLVHTLHDKFSINNIERIKKLIKEFKDNDK